MEGLTMTYSGSGDTGGAWRNDGGVQPHAFDPVTQPELFSGVSTKRVFAFLIDLVVIAVPVVLGYLFILLFGLLTLGLGWMLFWLAWPASVVWAIVYYSVVLGAMHAVLFWVSISFLTPFVVLVGLFNGRRRLLHDIVLGTVVINSFGRTQPAQPARTY